LAFLQNLSLTSALYLIQQCISGIQALTCKYPSFDLYQVFFCLNDKGECRTWVSKNLLDYKITNAPLPSEDLIIMYILKTIDCLCTHACKQELKKLGQQVKSRRVMTLTDMHVLLNEFAGSNNITTLYGMSTSQSQIVSNENVRLKT